MTPIRPELYPHSAKLYAVHFADDTADLASDLPDQPYLT